MTDAKTKVHEESMRRNFKFHCASSYAGGSAWHCVAQVGVPAPKARPPHRMRPRAGDERWNPAVAGRKTLQKHTLPRHGANFQKRAHTRHPHLVGAPSRLCVRTPASDSLPTARGELHPGRGGEGGSGGYSHLQTTFCKKYFHRRSTVSGHDM